MEVNEGPGSLLTVPIGLDGDGNVVRPGHAVKGELYFCPVCGGSLVYRQGEKRIWHFAHHSDGACTSETVLHKSAKLLIQSAVRRGCGEIVIGYDCQEVCGTRGYQKLDGRIENAELEYMVPGGYRADVALLGKNGELLLVVEVKVTHAVPEEKRCGLGVHWIEVEGAAILHDSVHWHAIDGQFSKQVCAACRKVRAEWSRWELRNEELEELEAQKDRRLASSRVEAAEARRKAVEKREQQELEQERRREHVEEAIRGARIVMMNTALPLAERVAASLLIDEGEAFTGFHIISQTGGCDLEFYRGHLQWGRPLTPWCEVGAP